MTDLGLPGALPDELLSALLDGELDTAERAAVEARLASDPEWARQLDGVREVRAALRSLPLAAPRASAWSELVAAVATTEPSAAEPSAGTVVDLSTRRRRRFALGAGAAAAVVAVLFAVPAGSGSGGGSAVEPSLPALADVHAGTSSFGAEPVSQLAPMVVPASLNP